MESWGRPYVATTKTVVNNLKVFIGGISFDNSQDHSKWAYSYEKVIYNNYLNKISKYLIYNKCLFYFF